MSWQRCRAKVWITGTTVHYIVLLGDDVIFYDNTGVQAWRKVYLTALARVDSVNHMLVSERKVKPYVGGVIALPPRRMMEAK